MTKAELLHKASEDKRRKDALICLKLLADTLIAEPSAILGEVLHLISKHNISKARSGVISALAETVKTEKSGNKVLYQIGEG